MEPPREKVMSRRRLAFQFNMAWLISIFKFHSAKVKYQRRAHENPAKHHTKHWCFLIFAPLAGQAESGNRNNTDVYSISRHDTSAPRLKKNKHKNCFQTALSLFSSVYSRIFWRVDGPSRRGAHVALKRPRTRRRSYALSIPGPACWERLHLLALLADVCVTWTASICSQAFPWDMELVVSGKSD